MFFLNRLGSLQYLLFLTLVYWKSMVVSDMALRELNLENQNTMISIVTVAQDDPDDGDGDDDTEDMSHMCFK